MEHYAQSLGKRGTALSGQSRPAVLQYFTLIFICRLGKRSREKKNFVEYVSQSESHSLISLFLGVLN